VEVEAASKFFNIVRWVTNRGNLEDKALCIGPTVSGTGHLSTVRGIIMDMDTPCQKTIVSDKTEYETKIYPITRKIVYSITHGVVEISSSPDDCQHIFLGLGLVAFDDFTGVDSDELVTYADLPNNHSFDLVFINACHSGDTAAGYSGSTATAFRTNFPSTVYIAARGGNNGASIVGSCDKCIGASLAPSMAADFFDLIRTERAADRNRTFAWIKEELDPEWDEQNPPEYHPEDSLYIIYGGETTNIFTVFPK
jgi:hypothetical protein